MIRAQDYKFIADNLGEAQSVGSLMYASLGEMLLHLDANDLSANNIDKKLLRGDILDAYQIILQSHVYVTDEMSRMVRALQNHVVFRYGTVDAFLQAHNLKVTESFARLSSQIGYEISTANIE